MPIESIPKFTPKAAEIWASIPAEAKKRFLSNVWCSQCRRSVTIKNFTGAVKAGFAGIKWKPEGSTGK
jgi:hypothetical protein